MKKTLFSIFVITLFNNAYAIEFSSAIIDKISPYIGLGVSNINSSADNGIDSVTSSVLTLGSKINDTFAIELASTVSKPTDDNGYELDHVQSIGLVADLPLTKQFSLLGKVGFGETKINGLNSFNETSLHYGLGVRYKYDRKLSIDGIYEQLIDDEINGIAENITQKSIGIKHQF
jgi:opacity protein-like surface antigen